MKHHMPDEDEKNLPKKPTKKPVSQTNPGKSYNSGKNKSSSNKKSGSIRKK